MVPSRAEQVDNGDEGTGRIDETLNKGQSPKTGIITFFISKTLELYLQLAEEVKEG